MTSPEEQSGGRLKALGLYAAYLALRQSEDQESIAAGLALGLYPIWMIQRFTELDRTTPLWLSAALPQVKTAYLQSQRVAAVFAQNVRFASLPLDGPLPMAVPDVERPSNVPVARFNLPDLGLLEPATPDTLSANGFQPKIEFDDFPVEDAAKSLAIQGNGMIKRAMPGPEQELMYDGLKNSSGAAVRHAMNGGRNATDNIVNLDRKILGFARVTDSNPCYFCALLASRGTVFGKGSFVASDAKFVANPNGAKDLPDGYVDIAKVHDHCRCQLRPVYAKSQEMDADALFYRAQWKDVWDANKHRSNKVQVQAWKAQYTPYKRPDPDLGAIRNELEQRSSALLNAGFSPLSPQVTWAQNAKFSLAA